MQLHIAGQDVELTPALKDFTNEKLGHLEKRYHNITNVNVVLRLEHHTNIAEATVHMSGTQIHATAKDGDMYKAIEMLAEKLLGQITKYKEKLIDSHR